MLAGEYILSDRVGSCPKHNPKGFAATLFQYTGSKGHHFAWKLRKLRSGEYRLYSRKINPKTKKRRNLGTFKSLAAAKKHEREIQYFKRH